LNRGEGGALWLEAIPGLISEFERKWNIDCILILGRQKLKMKKTRLFFDKSMKSNIHFK
jgi:hypothetical protein